MLKLVHTEKRGTEVLQLAGLSSSRAGGKMFI